jgi:hypothetical protein
MKRKNQQPIYNRAEPRHYVHIDKAWQHDRFDAGVPVVLDITIRFNLYWVPGPWGGMAVLTIYPADQGADLGLPEQFRAERFRDKSRAIDWAVVEIDRIIDDQFDGEMWHNTSEGAQERQQELLRDPDRIGVYLGAVAKELETQAYVIFNISNPLDEYVDSAGLIKTYKPVVGTWRINELTPLGRHCLDQWQHVKALGPLVDRMRNLQGLPHDVTMEQLEQATAILLGKQPMPDLDPAGFHSRAAVLESEDPTLETPF